jgi:curved DNA-binding protein CbpA
MERDPYEVLGIPGNASEEEIEEAYREKAKEYHPDVCDRDDAAEMFKLVKEAYEAALTDDSRRRDGDREAGPTREGEEGGGGRHSETLGNHGDGWSLGNGEEGWYVFTETETAPHVDGTVTMYLGTDGTVSSDPVYFGTEGEARATYREAYGETDAEEGEDTDETTGESGVSSDEDGVIWGDTRMSTHLDSLWRLCYQEGRTRAGGERRRRWGVTTDVSGDERYINADGVYQGTEFWFPTEDEAREGYRDYIRDMRQARSGSAGEGGGESSREGASATEHVHRHPVVQVAVEGLASVPERASPAVGYGRRGFEGFVELSRDPVISFLHYVTFPRLAAFTKASLKALVAGYAVLVIDIAWGPGVFADVFGRGFVRSLTSGMFPLIVYFAFVVLLFAALLED